MFRAFLAGAAGALMFSVLTCAFSARAADFPVSCTSGTCKVTVTPVAASAGVSATRCVELVRTDDGTRVCSADIPAAGPSVVTFPDTVVRPAGLRAFTFTRVGCTGVRSPLGSLDAGLLDEPPPGRPLLGP